MAELKGSRTEQNLMTDLRASHRQETNIHIMRARPGRTAISR